MFFFSKKIMVPGEEMHTHVQYHMFTCNTKDWKFVLYTDNQTKQFPSLVIRKG